VVELADAPDSKSGWGDPVGVRFPPPAPFNPGREIPPKAYVAGGSSSLLQNNARSPVNFTRLGAEDDLGPGYDESETFSAACQ
jgi:hypothetical protein